MALELGLPYRIEDDGLLLDDARISAMVERADVHGSAPWPLRAAAVQRVLPAS